METQFIHYQFTKVIIIVDRAIEVNPENAVYYCNRAAAYSRLDRHTDAMVDCRQAIKLDPLYGKAYGRLG